MFRDLLTVDLAGFPSGQSGTTYPLGTPQARASYVAAQARAAITAAQARPAPPSDFPRE